MCVDILRESDADDQERLASVHAELPLGSNTTDKGGGSFSFLFSTEEPDRILTK